MSDEYQIPSGDTKTVVQDASQGRDYAVEVSASAVRLSTSRTYAGKGSRLEDGDRAIVHLPPGDELLVYGDGDSAATVTVYPQGSNPALTPDDGLEFTFLPSRKMGVTGSVDSDVTDRAARTVGKVRLEDDGNALVKDSNPLPTATPTASTLHTDSLTGDGSMAGQTVPRGFTAAFKADPGNADTAFVNGFPLDPSEAVSLGVSDVSTPGITFNDQTDTVHVIVEVA